MKVLQVKNFPIWDIFEGEGWENWSRYLYKKGKLIYISGVKLVDKTQLNKLVKTIQHAQKI